MLFVVLPLPFLLYVSMRVALVDPRDPRAKPHWIGLAITVMLGSLPMVLFRDRDSALFNASLALGMSTVFSPLIFSAMNTDDKIGWIKDKVFVVLGRLTFAAVLAIVHTFVRVEWFLLLGAIALFSFLSRWPVWMLAGGNRRRYLLALIAVFAFIPIYYVMVAQSKVTPDNWTHWRAFLE